MTYVLNALIGRRGYVARWDSYLAARAVQLPQDLELLAITQEVYDRFGSDPTEPREEAFWLLHPKIAASATELSRDQPLAYLEAEIFGGSGTQAAVVWLGGRQIWGPGVTVLGHPTSVPCDTSQWAFNEALRLLGVRRDAGGDEFDAVGLGRHRYTEDWT